MFLVNYTSYAWQSNVILGLFWLILITDWLSFSVILSSGTLLGLLFYKYRHGDLPDDMLYYKDTFINLAWAVVIAILFSRKRELLEKIKELKKINKLNKKINKKNKQLKKALASKTEFLNNVSHEIRTPIQGITTISEHLAQDWQKLDDNTRQFLAKKVAANATRLFSFIRTILDLSRMNKGKLDMRFAPMSLLKSIIEIKEECEDLYLDSRNVEIQFDNTLEDAWINGDHERVMQVIRNLLTNSIKFTKSVIKLSLQYNHDEQIYVFTITDDGMGIPKKELEEIFKPFVQSTLTKTGAGGTGLGLTISRDIIKAHRGKIWAENVEPSGAKFTFTIPALTEFENISDFTKNTLKAPDIKNIIIIDDETSVLMSIEMMLHKIGYHDLKMFSDAKSAILFLESNEFIPDLIIVDLMMPKMNGIDFLSEISNISQLKSVPKLLQTGSHDHNLLSKLGSFENLKILHKPFNTEDLLENIIKLTTKN
ncbi:MAG: hypothetical protein BGO27_02050 [Alphaproteobacteria bacterium 33-17]|nr:MAG: hypothetical protein BGO27_02050 [Alphaproteobacteria bacterium 33-17]